jgi:hypothetical protein
MTITPMNPGQAASLAQRFTTAFPSLGLDREKREDLIAEKLLSKRFDYARACVGLEGLIESWEQRTPPNIAALLTAINQAPSQTVAVDCSKCLNTGWINCAAPKGYEGYATVTKCDCGNPFPNKRLAEMNLKKGLTTEGYEPIEQTDFQDLLSRLRKEVKDLPPIPEKRDAEKEIIDPSKDNNIKVDMPQGATLAMYMQVSEKRKYMHELLNRLEDTTTEEFFEVLHEKFGVNAPANLMEEQVPDVCSELEQLLIDQNQRLTNEAENDKIEPTEANESDDDGRDQQDEI